jgi:hypothetical protein
MKKYCFIFLLITVFISAFSPVGFAASQEITIVNASNSEIYDLSITPSNSTERGPNVLNGQSLPSGQSVRVVFPNYDPGITQWDVWGFDCCDERHSWSQLNLNSVYTITLQEGGIAEIN